MSGYFNLLDELLSLIEHLEEAHIEYALCGGLAVGVYGYPRATKDIDILLPETYLEQACQLVRATGFVVEPGLFTFQHARVYRLTKISETGDELPIDFLLATPENQTIWDSRTTVTLRSGLTISVVSPEGLIAMKRLRNNTQDQADIQHLEELGRS